MRHPFQRLIVSIAILSTSCTSSVAVKHVTPPRPKAPLTEADSKSIRDLGAHLDDARQYEARIVSGDQSQETIAAYNYSVARAVEAMEASELDPWGAGVEVPSANGSYRLKGSFLTKTSGIHPASYRAIPTDRFVAGGYYFKELKTQPGIGAPLAIVSDHQGGGIKHDLGESSVYGTATAVISFEGNNARLTIHESLKEDTATLKGRKYPLAADYSTPIALMVHNTKVESLGFARLIRPDRYAATARMTRLQIYDRERIPIVFVHGLDSTPGTWTPLLNALRGDPELRKKYQAWVFSYPSGYPYPYTATLLRKELDRMNRTYPDHKPMVLVGHSMGGNISRLMLTDSGDTIWRSYFGKPPGRTHLPGRHRAELEDALIFRHRTEFDRTIFISTPHRGSQLAIGRFGRLMSRLIKPPALLADIRDTVITVATVDATALNLERAPSSIDTLAPTNRFVKAVNQTSIASGTKYHSIIGDRGKGNTPDSSDGVVPYWSSHLDGAISEKIVPSGHSAHQNPQGIEETLRILRMHAGLPQRTKNAPALNH